ncbi:nuclear transport factor 2 family protein [Lacihabitans sp. LS3-19]|uniref:YybH family protein n=1 Tax=Lacihabitans sp. LS3-19 TaxID=2487335 RepID=UPI0020CCBCE4|nr:nuclear transport factor 2 family protein [Lacihabitans sp. LS3-19]MCP9770981.1 nuclear transport factor 2 family protein [Lacihabitans sp. LS3-19]
MKKRNSYLFAIAVLATSLSFSSCSETKTADTQVVADVAPDMGAVKSKIQERENTFAVAQTAGDVEALIALYTDDAISMGNDQKTLVGKEAIRKDVEISAAKRVEGNVTTFDVTEVFGNEDLITEIGVSTNKNAKGEVISKGKYMAIWKKVNGEYLVFRDIYNNDAPIK